MIRLVGASLLLGWLPGALTLRLPLGDRHRRERLDWDERAFWAVVLSVAWSAGAAFTLAVFGSYSFDRLLFLNGACAAVGALTFRSALRYRNPSRPRVHAIVPALLLGFGLWLYHPPAEYIIGGKDPGMYINEGVQIAQRGDVITRDDLVKSLPQDLLDLFIPPHHAPSYYGIRFMGFFVTDPARGKVVGQFPHLYPAAIAIGYGLDGLTGARHVSSTWAALGVVALFFLAARLVGRPAATVAAVLLAVNVVQVWFARYPNSEIVAQVLILAGMLAFARAYIDGDRFFGPVAALLLGFSLFARIDGVFAIAAACGAAILLPVEGRRAGVSFFGPLIAVCASGWMYFSRILSPYTQRPIETAERHVVALAALTAGVIAIYVAVNRKSLAPFIRAWIPRVLAIVLAGLAIYAFFFRVPSGRLAVHDANALRTYAWYVHPAALGAALIGLCLVVWRRFWQDPAWLLAVAFYSVFFFYKIQIVPEHFWMARRFLPVILPATMMCIGAVLMEWAGTPGVRTLRPANLPRVALRAALTALIVWSFVESSRPILRHVEYAGIIQRVESLASRIAPDDLLVVESRNASDLHVLALPLAYIYAKPVLVLNSPKPDKQAFAKFVGWARQRYRQVYFLGGGGTDLLSSTVGVEPIASERFQVPEYESRRNAYPTHVRAKEFDYGLYRFVTPGTTTGVFALDVGDKDDLYVVRFHAKERDRRGTFRWTQRQSYVSIPALTTDRHELVLWMQNGGRSPKAPPARVEAFIGDHSIGTVVVGPVLQPYSFAIATGTLTGNTTTIRLVTDTWNPRATMGVADDRDLGVMVDRLEVR
jgi:hypothetical protein